jgi:hypothetical protein
MKLLIDPALLLPGAHAPQALIERHGVTETTFGHYPADPATGPRCGRCNDLLHIHVWQLVDGTEILACARETS